MLKIVPGEPVAVIEGLEKVLIAADLHIGFERELAQLGINIPSQVEKLFTKLQRIISRVKPDRVILLGDVKHGVPAITDQEWSDLPVFFERLIELGVKVEVILGNHDGGLEPLTPRQVEIHDSRGITIEGVGLIHGHAWPSSKLLKCKVLLMGHNHPVIEFRDQLGFREVAPTWLSMEVNAKSRSLLSKEVEVGGEGAYRSLKLKKVVVMPAFNTLLSGKPINTEDNRKLLGPLLESGALKTEEAEVYLLDGTFMGKIFEVPRLA
ncbi:MAG: metallophosphoesterase [Candidatus Nezhaarchaeota archaeon]|nr:metallophosphoesterase [Candidatus Nezhaarchaeota archaeon]